MSTPTRPMNNQNGNNSQGRKRKHPSSPSGPHGPRPSPYTPNSASGGYQPPSGGRGRGPRRQSGSLHNQQQHGQQQQQQGLPSTQRTPSRLSISENSPTNSTNPANAPSQDVANGSHHGATPPSPASTYFWEYVTDTNLRSWASTGYKAVRDAIIRLAESANTLDLSVLFQELIKSAVEARLVIPEVVRLVTDTIENGGKPEFIKLSFVQTATLFETTDSKDPTPPNLITLLNSLHPRPIPTETFALHLESHTLVTMGVVSSIFSKKAVRVTTGLVYKQRKHNLLREETEGFSKLITEFFTASYSSFPLEAVAGTGERVKGLVGAFELDPGRVLDILLDTAACTIVSNARFFVRLLKCSAWWPQPLPAEEIETLGRSREEIKAEKEAKKEQTDRQFFDRLRNEGIGPLFDQAEQGRGGNKVAAQLLGFKFRYYNQEDVQDPIPENLYVLAALLIKIGFIDLMDLLPHLAPYDDEGMQEVEKHWKKSIDPTQRTPKANALTMAGALADDTIPQPRSKPTNHEKKPEEKKKEPKKEEEKPKTDLQKIVLLKYLLALGALSESTYLLAKYKWLPGAVPDVADHLGRIITYSIENIYAPLSPKTGAMGSGKIATSQVGKTGGVELYDQPRRKPMITFLVSNLKLKSGDAEFRFFWEDWKDGVPVCRTPRDVVTLMETFGRFLGVRIGKDPSVFTTLCRIGRAVLQDPACSKEDKNSWINLSRWLLVPAISLTDGNQGVVNEVWKLLECFSLETRYTLYGEWTTTQVTMHGNVELKAKVQETEMETREVLKKISKTTIKIAGRKLAKVAASNPVTVLKHVLRNVQEYDNIIECIVDAVRYFTPLAFDVLGFAALHSFSEDGKDSLQADGLLTSKWLRALAQFCAKIYTRYYQQMNPAPLLEYVARQLMLNHSSELILLQQLIQYMAGINPESNLNDSQLQGLAGGEILRKQVLKAFRDRKAEDTPETMKRLIQTLSDSNLTAELLILIAQVRQTCAYRDPSSKAPLKVLANDFDEIHVVLNQYLELLRMGMPLEQFEKTVPSIDRLCLDFGIEPAAAWTISRPTIKGRMAKLEASDGEDVEMKDAASAETAEAPKSPWNPYLEKIMEDIKPIFPDDVWTKISPSFYVTFWNLSLYDIVVPMETYQAENSRLNASIKAIAHDRSDPSTAGNERKRLRQQLLWDTHDKISTELRFHIRDHRIARKRLSMQKDHWFKDEKLMQRDITNAFIQYCLLPRALLSPNDASFCSRIIKEVHKLGTPKFHTVGVYDSIMSKALRTIIFVCTQREAENFGRFLKEVLADLQSWHADRTLYESNALGKGLTGFYGSGKPIDWEDFRRLLYKWHKALHTAVKICFASKEYMHIRNAIIILKNVAEYFPAVDWVGRNLVERVEELVKTEKREDLKIAGTTLLGLLKKHEKRWVLVASYIQKSDAANMKPSPTPTPAPPNTDKSASQTQQQRTQSSLSNAIDTGKAATSSPSTPPVATKTSAPVPVKAEVEKEDGEIEDSRNRRGTASLPQKPAMPMHDMRKPQASQMPHPQREQPRPQTHLQNIQLPPSELGHSISRTPSANSRAPTPRRDEQRQSYDSFKPERTEVARNMNQPSRQMHMPAHQSHPHAHQLPERPDLPRQSTLDRRIQGASLDLDRRDIREPPRDSNSRPVDGRSSRPSDVRLPEKPLERRHSPRRDSREIRHEQDRRGVRDGDFQRPPSVQVREERLPRKEERIMMEPQVESGSGRQLRGQQPPPMMDDRGRRIEDRDKDRRERHDRMSQQTGRLNEYPMERPDLQDRRMAPDRRQDIPPPRHLPEPTRPVAEPPRHIHEDVHPQRPPAGPRADFDRDNRAGRLDQSPMNPKERELFTGPSSQMRAPSGPTHREPFNRDNRPSPSHFHQDPNHGRLNPPDLMSIPKGPRDRNPPFMSRGNLNIRGTSRETSTQQQQQPPQHQPPQANPAAGRNTLPSPQEAKGSMPPPVPEKFTSHSAPTTPSADTVGIHPDRLKALGQQPPSPPSPSDLHVHPSRLPPTSLPSPVNTQPPPLGPRGNAQERAGSGAPNRQDSMSMPSPAQGGHGQRPGSPPTGPARPERNEDVRNNRRRINNLQSILAPQEDSQGMGREIRGRGRRGAGSSGMVTPHATTPRQERELLDLMGPQPGVRDTPRNSISGGSVPLPPGGGARGGRSASDIDPRRASLSAPMPVLESERIDLSASHGRSRHHRSERADRSDRAERERERERDQRHGHSERERERERERGFDDGRSGGSRKGSDRESRRSSLEPPRGAKEHRGERDGGRERDRDRERERERERDGGRDNRERESSRRNRGEDMGGGTGGGRERLGREESRRERDLMGGRDERDRSGRDGGRKHPRDGDKGRDGEQKRSRRGEWDAGRGTGMM